MRARIRSLFVAATALAAASGCALLEDPAPAGPSAHSLAGEWTLWLDPGAVGLDDGWARVLCEGGRPATAPGDPLRIAVPGPLEALSETQGYDGVVWYARRFAAPPRLARSRVRLELAQVNYLCRVFLDGEPVGGHEGGYDAFSIDLTGRLDAGGEHGLAIMVLDPGAVPTFGLSLSTTPHSKESWYENFGGLLGPVSLHVEPGWRCVTARLDAQAEPERVLVSAELLSPLAWRAGPVRVALSVSELPPAAATAGSAHWRTGARELVRVEQGLNAAAGLTTLALAAGTPGARRWSPEDPVLHRVRLEVDGRVVLERNVGFRTVALEPDGFHLNGRRRVLKGVLYQPHFIARGGVAPPDEELERTVLDMKASGFDLVRAHVRPAPPALLDAADRHGLLVLEEPAIGWVGDEPALLPRLLAELDWMVARDGHHPSIVLWGVLNEMSGKAYRQAPLLAEHLAARDPTRPVLEDSGGFFGGGRYLPAGASDSLPMVDRHCYPPWPLPMEERDALLALDHPSDTAGLAGLGGHSAEDHVAAGERVPVFVSEFGHGTLLDTAPTVARFREAGLMSAERVLFESFAAVARRARQSGEAWTDGDWVDEAAEGQADAAEDMIEALRSNPALDLLCYTQWQAVSGESSAGLLGPWGESRPARERVRRALRPLMTAVLVERPSLAVGEAGACRVAVVNDGAPRGGRLVLELLRPDQDGFVEVGGAEGPFAAGVTHLDFVVPAAEAPGLLRLRSRLLGPAGAAHDVSTERALHVAASPAVSAPPGALVWAAPSDAPARAAAQRFGLALAATPREALVALVSDPARLREGLGLDDRLRLWDLVWRGGALVVLLPDPGASPQARMLGLARGVTTLTELPQAAAISAAAGHFMGRAQLVRDPQGAVRLLGRGDEVLSPLAMVVGGLPEGADARGLTLSSLGHRLGATDIVLPFGAGEVRLIGLPLLAELGGRVEPRRDAELAARLGEQLARAAERGLVPSRLGAWEGLTAVQRQLVDDTFSWVESLVDLADRHSPFAAAAGAPPARLAEPAAGALALRDEAVQHLMRGEIDPLQRALGALAAAGQDERTRAFIALDARVLAALAARVEAGSDRDWRIAHQALEEWVRGLTSWFAGERDVAFDWLGRAELLLATGGGA